MTDETEGTEPAQKPAEETLDYEAELDELDKEFDETQQQQTQTDSRSNGSPDVESRLAKLEAENAELRNHIQGDQTEKAIAEAMRSVKGDTELTIPDRYLRKLVVGEVSDNPTLLRAYANRQQNPGAWNKALKAMGREFQKDFGKKDTTETSDIEAVEASVRGQHTASDERKPPPKLPANPTREQLAKWRQEVTGG